MKKYILLIILAGMFSLFLGVVSTGLLRAQPKSPLTVDQNIEDFNFALKELETSYAGFDTYVNDATRQEYDSIPTARS